MTKDKKLKKPWPIKDAMAQIYKKTYGVETNLNFTPVWAPMAINSYIAGAPVLLTDLGRLCAAWGTRFSAIEIPITTRTFLPNLPEVDLGF